MATYAPLPVTFDHGQGAWLWDSDGNKYLDALSGVAVCGLGHAHPAVTQAICQQAEKLIHTSNIYGIAAQQTLAEKLTQLAGMDKAFFCNSGLEANETALKLARLYGHNKGIDNPVIVVTENSFHGRSIATLTATGNHKLKAGFEPLLPGFVRVPFNDMVALKEITSSYSDIVAILLEPVQGEGGINVPDDNYLPEVRQYCDDNGWLMMLDEIQTGMCRTGEWFAFQHNNIVPDVVTLAKGLGNGVPIGACLARGQAADTFTPGSHGSTFGGNPLACTAALAVIKTIEDNDLASRAQSLGARFLDGLHKQLDDCDQVVQIKSKGLMIGIELDQPCKELVKQALGGGLLINVTADNVVRLLPPMILTDEEADQIIDTVAELIRNLGQQQ